MQFKQNTKELDENFAVISKQLLPAVLQISDSNLQLITNYLIQRHIDASGMIDASAQNIGKAITACVNALRWDTPPKKKKPAEAQGLTRLKSTSEILRDQNAEAEKLAAKRASTEEQIDKHTRVMEILGACEELLSSNRTVRRYHHKTQKLRDSLRDMLNKSRAGVKTIDDAENLYNRMLSYADSVND